jgi:hypothetical protein
MRPYRRLSLVSKALVVCRIVPSSPLVLAHVSPAVTGSHEQAAALNKPRGTFPQWRERRVELDGALRPSPGPKPRPFCAVRRRCML